MGLSNTPGCEDERCLDTLTDTDPPANPDIFTWYWDTNEEYITAIEFGTTPTVMDYYSLIIDKSGTSATTDVIDFSDVKQLAWCKNNGRLRHMYAVDSTAGEGDTDTDFPKDLLTGEVFNTETLNPLALPCDTTTEDELWVAVKGDFPVLGMRAQIEQCTEAGGCGAPPTEIRHFAWQIGAQDGENLYFIEESYGFATEKYPTLLDFETLLESTECLEGNRLEKITISGGAAIGATSMTGVWKDGTPRTATAPGPSDDYTEEITVPEKITQVQINSSDDGSIGGLRFWDGSSIEEELCTSGCEDGSSYFWREKVEWPENAVLMGFSVDPNTPTELRDLSFIIFLE